MILILKLYKFNVREAFVAQPLLKMSMKLLPLLFLIFAHSASGLSEGDTAPGFTLMEIENKQPVTLADYADQIIYLDFWASWCGPCRVSLPEIVKIQEALASEKFTVIAINVDKDREKGIKFLQRYPVNYPVLSDAAGEVAKAFELPGMPSSFVIDHGKISLVHKGYRSGDMMIIRAHIEDLLNESR